MLLEQKLSEKEVKIINWFINEDRIGLLPEARYKFHIYYSTKSSNTFLRSSEAFLVKLFLNVFKEISKCHVKSRDFFPCHTIQSLFFTPSCL